MVAHDVRWCHRRGEQLVDFVDAEMVELGEHARHVVAIAVHVAPPSCAQHAWVREQWGDAIARVRIERAIGHLEIEPRCATVLQRGPSAR